MKKVEPKATSTPTRGPHLKGRRGIRDEDDSIQSPITLEELTDKFEFRATSKSPVRRSSLNNSSSPRHSPRQSPQGSPIYPRTRAFTRNENLNKNSSVSPQILHRANSISATDTESDNSDVDYKEREENQFRCERARQEDEVSKGSFMIYGKITLIIAFLVIIITGLYSNITKNTSVKDETPYDLNKSFIALEKQFKIIDEDFWRSIKVSIQEITLLRQPSSILFLYESNSEKLINSIINKVAQNALCHLSHCSNKAVEIEGASLNTSETIKDYGKIIVQYQDALEKNKVLIVKNLEKVPGEAAQAFHSFCDNDHAVVEDALILFTLEVKNLPINEYPRTFVERLLLQEWSKIGKDDKFYPLFARISGTILSVRSK